MDLDNLRVFIAEDEPIVLLGCEAMVSECGHTVVGTASDGLAAVAGVLETNPDIIIMDINMPLMDGLTALEKIQEHRKIPAIIITGFKSKETVERACIDGVFAYLNKPVNECEIRSALRIAAYKANELEKIQMDRDKAKADLEGRKIIEQAKGVLMDEFGLSEAQAMKALQRKSNNENVRLIDAARKILKAGK